MLSQETIDTVIFDLDGTLRHNIPSADETQYNFTLQLGIIDTPSLQHKGARWAHYYWAQSPELFTDIKKFGEMDDDFWTNYSFRYLMSLAVPQKQASDLAPRLFQLMKDGFNPESRLAPDVPETLQALRETGFTLGLVSNRSSSCHQECEELGLLPYFEFVYVAAEVNVWKPDPAIFDRALEQTGCPPARTIYVGDNYYADIVAAQRAGIHPILFDPTGVFPEAACTVIRSVGDLLEILL